MYIEGHKNKVADALSRYYESSNDDDIHYDEYISADIKLDKNRDNLPIGRAEEASNLLLKRQNHITVLTASDKTEPKQMKANSLDPLTDGEGGAVNQLVN